MFFDVVQFHHSVDEFSRKGICFAVHATDEPFLDVGGFVRFGVFLYVGGYGGGHEAGGVEARGAG